MIILRKLNDILRISYLFILGFTLYICSLKACTAFTLKSDSELCAGKNLDWPIGDGCIVINQRGIDKFSMTPDGQLPIQWTSRYGSVTFNQLSREFPLGGMNEAGLVVEELSYTPTVYPAIDSFPMINELQWIQYQLDNYASVDEVLTNLHQLRISKLLFGLHFFLTDREGQSAVIEFISGKVRVYTGDNLEVPVLSNNSYENSLRYLRMFQGFGGNRPIMNRSGSQERFVRTAHLISIYNQSDSPSPIAYAFRILEEVRQEDTQWSIVYQPVNGRISFSIKDNKAVNTIDLEEIDFSDQPEITIFPLSNDENKLNIIKNFQANSHEINKDLLSTVFRQLVELEEIEAERADNLVTEIQEYLNRLDGSIKSEIY
jgi:choloylglycine hydrolase